MRRRGVNLITVIFLTYTLCQKHLCVVPIYHSLNKLSAYLTGEGVTGFEHPPSEHLAIRFGEDERLLGRTTGLVTSYY